MDLYPEKVGEKNGGDSFVLKNAKTKQVVTKKEVTEAKVRKFFLKHGADEQTIDNAILIARRRYDKLNPPDVDDDSDFFDDMIGDLSADDEF